MKIIFHHCKRSTVIGLFALWFLGCSIMPLWSDTPNPAGDPEAKIEAYVREIMEEGDIPGLSLVIIKGNTPPIIKSFGYADKEKKIPVTPSTLFELGSCSKAFTGLAALQLAQQGLIDLDAPVSRYLPWFFVQYQDKKTGITLRQCLHHTSGIPWNTLAKIPPDSKPTALEKAVKNIVGTVIKIPPGVKYEYVSVNYDIVGAVIEKVTGKSFEEYMKQHVFKPLALSHTFVGIGQMAFAPSPAARGYKIGYFSPRPYNPPVFRGNNPAAYVVSNAPDMARWLRIQMGLEPTDFAPLVQRSHLPDLTILPAMDHASYAIGWFVDPYRKHTIFHGGVNPTFTSYIGFRPRGKIGVALLANSNSAYTGFIGGNILSLLAGEGISPTKPPRGGIDSFCSILSFIVGLYVLVLVTLIVIRIIGGFRGKIRLESLNGRKILRLFVALVMGIPFYLGIYFIPYALAGMPWSTALVWSPLSFSVFVALAAASLTVAYLYFLVSLLLVTKKKYRNEIPLITIISILSGLAGTGILALITTSFFSTTNLFFLVYYFCLTYLLHVFGKKIMQTKLTIISNHIALDLRINLIHKIFSTRYQHFEKLQDGRLFTTLNDDTAALAGSASHVIILTSAAVTAIATFLYMASLSITSTMVVLGAVGIIIVYNILVGKRSRVFMEMARDAQNVYMSLLNGLIKGYKELVLQRSKKREYKDDIIDSSKEFCTKNITSAMKFINAGVISESMILIILGMLSIVVPRLFPRDEIITLVAFVMAILYLFGPLGAILNTIRPVTQLQVSWNRIKDLVKDLGLEQNREESVKEFIRSIDTPESLKPVTIDPFHLQSDVVENVKVEGLMFTYEGKDQEAGFSVGPIDFEVHKGEALFVVGGNGSGKTTLAKLLTGLYPREGGTIYINHKEVDQEMIGEYFSTILSNYHLFEKIYGTDIKNKEAPMQNYLKRLGIQDKVTVQEGKYSTLDLSGGQRKRLALFQCYLEDRPIFLFDELAADQDPEFRKLFYRVLLPDMKKQGKIIIAITHDDHYFDAADKIIKFDMGEVDYFLTREEYIKHINPIK